MGKNFEKEVQYKKMTVGFKYCGGCNPRYNRVEKVEEFKIKHPELNYVKVGDTNSCDFWIVVCGCKAACASVSELDATEKVLGVDSEEKSYEINNIFILENN